jgi:hypothetical protein
MEYFCSCVLLFRDKAFLHCSPDMYMRVLTVTADVGNTDHHIYFLCIQFIEESVT